MAKPHLAVEEAEDVVVVDVVCDGVDGGPRCVFEETLGEGLEGGFVHLVDLVDIFFADVTVEVDHEGFNGVRDEVRVVTKVLWGLLLLILVAFFVVLVRHGWSRVWGETQHSEVDDTTRLGFAHPKRKTILCETTEENVL